MYAIGIAGLSSAYGTPDSTGRVIVLSIIMSVGAMMIQGDTK